MIVKDLYVFFKLRPYIQAFLKIYPQIQQLQKELPTMKLSWASAAHVAAIAATALATFGGFIPPSFAPWAVLAQGIVQAILGAAQHKSNPDGTPAALPFVN